MASAGGKRAAGSVPLLAQDSDSEEEDEEIAIVSFQLGY